MVVCFKCPHTTKTKLDSLLESDQFADYSEIINAAIESFAVLHEEVQGRGSIVLSTERGDEGDKIPVDTTQESSAFIQKLSIVRSSKARDKKRVPELFTLDDLGTEAPDQLAPLPGDVFFQGQPVPIDRWIFGQYSKLLPVKASCRALAHMYPPPVQGLELEKVASRIAQEAEALGEFLAERDHKSGLSRDQAWAIGFPSGKEKADRSRLRYANQFVGAIGKQGTLTGLLIDLKLINLAKNGVKRILLTRVGWEFAVLENPVLDGGLADGKFTQVEAEFLLQHIQDHVPVEDFAFRAILNAIREGRDTPDKLNEICQDYVPTNRSKEVTQAVITSQRAGVVARLIDLGLIRRRRDGVRVSYEIGALANWYADNAA